MLYSPVLLPYFPTSIFLYLPNKLLVFESLSQDMLVGGTQTKTSPSQPEMAQVMPCLLQECMCVVGVEDDLLQF